MDYQYPPGTIPGSDPSDYETFEPTMAIAYPEQRNQPPSTPPPNYTPSLSAQPSPRAVDPGAISHCLFRFTYIWLRNRQSFWAFPVFVGRVSMSGWRWTGRRWVFFGVDLREIRSFTC